MKAAVYAALIASVSAIQFAEGDTTPAWGLRTLTDHRLEAQTQIGFGNSATEAANARPPLRSHVQVESDSSSSDSDSDDDLIQQKDYFPRDNGHAGYERKIPVNFQTNADDIFMRAAIQDFATEGEVTDDGPTKGDPTGVFTLNEAQAKALGSSVLSSKKGLTGEALAEYLGLYWAKTWRHYDVNQSGSIPVGYAPMLARFLANDQSLQL